MDGEIESFVERAGSDVARRFQAYQALKEAHAPEETTYYVTAVGVSSQARGTGVCSRLMSWIHDQAHRQGLPVGLDTQVASNVELYEHMGYRVKAEDHLGDLPIWFMTRGFVSG
jgi:GNAT superfamily N-acetyltransferase